jgi:hypothetical protein
VLKSARALCIVIHLVNHKTQHENRLEESTWSSQVNTSPPARGPNSLTLTWDLTQP